MLQPGSQAHCGIETVTHVLFQFPINRALSQGGFYPPDKDVGRSPTDYFPIEGKMEL